MKYTILGFQQEKLIENKLSIEDAFILRTIKDMYSSATMEFKDFSGIKFMWINYTYLLEQIPIVGSKRNLKRKIELYGKDFLLLRTLTNVRKGKKGNFSYISPTAKLDGLQDYDLMTESPNPKDRIAQPLGQNRPRVRTESPNKDTSIIDPSIKDNSIKDNNIYIFEEFWNLYPKKTAKTAALKTWNTLIKNRTNPDDLITASKNYALSRNGQDQQFTLQASTFLGPQKRFEDFINYIPTEDIPKRNIDWSKSTTPGLSLQDQITAKWLAMHEEVEGNGKV